jgi:arylformamidase
MPVPALGRSDALPGLAAGSSGYPVDVTTHVDVTVPLVPGLVPLYPGDTDLSVRREQHRAQGAPANVSSLTCSLHCGTHVDAPVHFFDGQGGVDTVPVETLLGPAWVADATGVEHHIDGAALSSLAIPDDATRVLLKTSNSALWTAPGFVEEFVAVTPDAATVLAGRGVVLVGIDYLSIAPYQDPAPTHEVFLRAGVTIVENLDLRAVEPGWWALTCLPLRIPGADGAPARAVLSRPSGPGHDR